MTQRRRLFETWHKPAGWCLVVFAGVVQLLGATLAAAPEWLFGCLGAAQSALLLAALDCMLRRRWVDTHAALWGPAAAARRRDDAAAPPTR